MSCSREEAKKLRALGRIFVPFGGERAPGRFVRRLNRFIAEVELPGGSLVAAHVSSTGRMRELLVEGAPVMLLHRPGATRKTHWDLLLVRHAGAWVCVDARRANDVAAQLLTACSKARLAREVRSGAHRFDFALFRSSGTVWIEVKAVTLVEEGVALFPDAPTVRGTRQIRGLIARRRAGERAAILFLVQGRDASCFAPHARVDPAFAAALGQAARAGVWIGAFACRVLEGGIEVGRPLKVRLPGVDISSMQEECIVRINDSQKF